MPDELPNRTGREWLATFMEAQALVAANTMFLPFQIGQLGVALQHDPAAARNMIKQMKTDRRDLKRALSNLDRVVADMIGNAERSLARDARG